MTMFPRCLSVRNQRSTAAARSIQITKAIGICLWLVLSQSAQADSELLQACREAGKALVTIGLPERHRTLVRATRDPDVSGAAAIAAGQVCAAYAYGNDYQILDWLETGKIDAAIVSPFVAEMFHERGEKPLSEFFGMATVWPFDGRPLPRYRVQMEVIGPDGKEPAPAEAYDRIIELLASSEDVSTLQIIADSHLSAALPLLLDYTEYRRQVLGKHSDDENDLFWLRFMRRLQLSDDRPQANAVADGFVVVARALPVEISAGDDDRTALLSGQDSLQDVFVHTELLHDRLFSEGEYNPEMQWHAKTLWAWLHNKTAKDVDIDPQLYDILNNTFAIREAGFRTHRHFRFKLDELWTVLGQGRDSDDQFALILTGGGVKAAYQTSLIDHLYGKGYLSNTRSAATSGSAGIQKPIKVDHVIGTSGGALLGTFVMAIEDEADPKLTETLWVNDKKGQYIGNFDVFPFFEMPRYLTLVVAGLLFSAVLLIARRIPRSSGWTEPTTLPEKYRIKEPNKGVVPPRVVWFILLAFAPWIIKLVNGVKGLEHVPAVTGLFYFACVLIAIISDNRLIFRDSFRWRHIDFRGISLVLLVGGMVLTFVPFVAQLTTKFEIGLADLGELTLATLVCCVGILAIFVAIHLAFASSGTNGADTEKVDGWIIFKALVVLFLVPVIATVMVWVTGISLFELSREFWSGFASWSVAATALLIFVGHWRRTGPVGHFVKVGLDFLAAEFPRSTFMLHLRRYWRVTGFAALAFLYWNVVMAPAIYGNGKAKEYFEETYKKAVCTEEMTERECDEFIARPIPRPPTTNFVVSATSLEKKRERYFVFETAASLRDATNAGDKLGELLKRDPRWIAADPDVKQQALINVVFASGSPFPVFPATRAGFAEKADDNEWLVDGGFAHNVPIEAANALGARRVLVISSSPLHQHEPSEGVCSSKSGIEEMLRWGNLICNVPRLFPYLFERSQVEDVLSAEQMLVATISPVPRGKGEWPALTDFKSDVVEYLLEAAEEDKDARIGIVESWGPPTCELQGVSYGCEELKAIEASREAD